MTGLNHFACPQTVTFPVHSIRWLRKKLRLAIVIIMLLLFLCVCFSGWNQHKCCVSQHKCERSAYVCVCVSWCACVCVWACVGVCMETCEHVCVCVRLHIHPNLQTYSLRACVCMRTGDSMNARVFVFQCESVSLCFVWQSMCSKVLLCYWFLCEYLYIPCFSLIKRQSALSRRTPHTINSI